MKKKKTIKENFIIDPFKGAVASLIGIQKEGYKVKSIIRKNTKAVVVYEEDN
jgi:hypothetical protein